MGGNRLHVFPRRRRLVLLGALLLALLGGGCVSAGLRYAVLSREQFQRVVQERGVPADEAMFPFAVTPEMVAFARRATAQETGTVRRLRRLQAALFDPGLFPFRYEERTTLPAPEAFRERRGNCLTSTTLFVALSRALGYATQIYAVPWVVNAEKTETLIVISSHVVAGYRLAGRLYVFDFSERREAPVARFEPLGDLTVAGLFHVNRGAMLLEQGDLAGAYRQLMIGVRLAPSVSDAWVNLGVVQRRMGNEQAALRAYRRALELEPGNPSALTNIAYVYTRQGRIEEARAALAAAVRGPSSPYSLVALADLEMAAGELGKARRLLRRALRRPGGRVPEVYRALARWARREGRERLARKYEHKAERAEYAERREPRPAAEEVR